MPAKKPVLKDPKGGLTAAGRKHFAKTEGAHLKPGVQKAERDMTPEEMRRKGSFLRRHYGRKNPFRLVDKKGEPTPYALQAQAWGEKLPKSAEDIKRLAEKGHKLLEKAAKAESKSSASSKGTKASSGRKTSAATRAKKSAVGSKSKTASSTRKRAASLRTNSSSSKSKTASAKAKAKAKTAKKAS